MSNRGDKTKARSTANRAGVADRDRVGARSGLGGKEGKPRIYRHEWEDTDNPLVTEARMQTLAIQRLLVWLRLAYSALAIAVLGVYWGFFAQGPFAAGVAGVIVGVIALFCVLVLRTGISNGRKNVNAMLEVLQPSDSVDEEAEASSKPGHSKAKGSSDGSNDSGSGAAEGGETNGRASGSEAAERGGAKGDAPGFRQPEGSEGDTPSR